VRWLVRLGWLTAAYSMAVIGWTLLPGDRLLSAAVYVPYHYAAVVAAAAAAASGVVWAWSPRLRAGMALKHPNRLLASAGIVAALVVVGVLAEAATTPYPSHPSGTPRIVNGQYVVEVKNWQYLPVSRQAYLDLLESRQRGSVEVVLLVNLILLAVVGAAADELQTPARNVRLPLLGEEPRWLR
jgi:hypothetical protein